MCADTLEEGNRVYEEEHDQPEGNDGDRKDDGRSDGYDVEDQEIPLKGFPDYACDDRDCPLPDVSEKRVCDGV